MERTCTLSFDATGVAVLRIAAGCGITVMLLLLLVEKANASYKTSQAHCDELSSSLVAFLSYLKYKCCMLQLCSRRCLVQNRTMMQRIVQILNSCFQKAPAKWCCLDMEPGYSIVCCVLSTCKCILQFCLATACVLKLGYSITQRVARSLRGTSLIQQVCQLKTCYITGHLTPTSLFRPLILKLVYIPVNFGPPCNEPDCGTEALNPQDTSHELKTRAITRNQMPDLFACPAHGLTALDSYHLVGEEDSDDKLPSRGSLFNWLGSCSLVNELRNIRFKKLLPTGVRFKVAFFSIMFFFLLLSTLTCVKFVTNSKKYPRETSVFIIVICSLQLAEAMPYSSHMEILTLGTREASNGTSVIPLKGSPNTGYCVMIGIGSENKQEFCVLLDTGSANLAIAGKQHPDIDSQFHPEDSSSYRDLGTTVTVSYTAGSWTGRLAKDSISIGGSNSVEAFLVVIESAEDFYIKDADWVGIMGLAYSNLAKPDSSVTPFWEAFQAATGKPDIFSFQFCPPLDIPLLDITEPNGGAMVLGGIDETLYHGPVLYTSLVQQRFYNVLVTNMTVGETVISLDCGEVAAEFCSVLRKLHVAPSISVLTRPSFQEEVFNNDQSIVDSGTTDVFLPQKVFTEVKNAFIDSFKDDLPLYIPEEFWNGGYKLAWAVDDKHSIYSAFPTFYISFATHNNASLEFSLAVTPQIYLRQIEGTSEEQANTNCFPECDFFTFGIKQRQQGTVIGGNIMLGFYTIFDRENRRIGFAQSTCEYQDDLGGLPHIVGPYTREPIDCQCADCKQGQSYWEITTYVCGVIVIPLAVTSVIFAVFRRMKRSHCYSKGVSISICRENYCGYCCKRRKHPTQETETLLEEQVTETYAEGTCSSGSPIPETDEEDKPITEIEDDADKKKCPPSVEESKPGELDEREDTQLCLRNERGGYTLFAADCQEQDRTSRSSTDLDLTVRNTSLRSSLNFIAGVSSAISPTESYGTVNMPMQETEHSCASATVYTRSGKNALKSTSKNDYDVENEVVNTAKQLEKETGAHMLKEHTPLLVLVSDSDSVCRQPEEIPLLDEPQCCTIEELTPLTIDSCIMVTDPKPIHSGELGGPECQRCRKAVIMERQASGPHQHDLERYGRQVSCSCSLAADSGNLSTQTSCEESLLLNDATAATHIE